MNRIENAIEALRCAMMSANGEELDRLTGEELSYGHTSGLIEDKATFIHSIVSEKDVFKQINISEIVISVIDEVATVRHRFQAEVLVSGLLAKPDIRVLQVWRERNGGWRLIARQAYKV